MSSTTAANIERVAFISLGCPKNLVDFEQMLGTVREVGFTAVSSDDPADAIVVNTLFLESSKEEPLQIMKPCASTGKAKGGGAVLRASAKILIGSGIDAAGFWIVIESSMQWVGWRRVTPDGEAAPPY